MAFSHTHCPRSSVPAQFLAATVYSASSCVASAPAATARSASAAAQSSCPLQQWQQLLCQPQKLLIRASRPNQAQTHWAAIHLRNRQTHLRQPASCPNPIRHSRAAGRSHDRRGLVPKHTQAMSPNQDACVLSWDDSRL